MGVGLVGTEKHPRRWRCAFSGAGLHLSAAPAAHAAINAACNDLSSTACIFNGVQCHHIRLMPSLAMQLNAAAAIPP